MKEYVIGVDIGTGSVKALAADHKGTVHSSAQLSYPLIQDQEDQCEQEPEKIWLAFAGCISKVVADLKQNPQAIILSSAMHSVIVIGDGDVPLTQMLTWADNRAGDIAERIHRSASGEMLYEQTGTPIHAMSPLCKIVWFREESAEIFNKARKFVSIKEFIWFRMFGVYQVDYSIASAAGLMDIETLKWNINALSVAEIREEQLSELVNTNYFRSDIKTEAAAKLGVASTTKVIIGASDGCMANLGSFATEPGIAALTIGTSGAVRVATKKPVYNFEAMTFNYRLDSETYISGGPTNNGGVVLKWYSENFLRKRLTSSDDYHELLNRIKAIPPGAEGLIFLPYLLGERAPIWNSDATGVFFGIRSHHTQEHFTRAIVEGISMALYNIAESMERCGLVIDQINVSGGFVHSTEWLEVLANIFGKKICLVSGSDASALGAAYLGLKTLRKITDYSELKQKDTKEILPDLFLFRSYQKQYRIFRELYKSIVANMEAV
jgi:gluconokinase